MALFLNAIKQEDEEAEIIEVIKALVIDDSALDQFILKKMLLNYGFNVCIASTENEAVEMFVEYQPDIVFMDLHFPDTNGYDLTKILKKLSQDNYVPVIFVTGTTDDESLGKCLESGGDDFIVKPIKENLLKAKINSLLRVKKMHDEVLGEKEFISSHRDQQLKDLYDADKVIYNIHKPRFYNPGNLDWTCVALNILSGDIVCSAMDPSGNHVILIGDNTGHGLPAAIGSMITCETFYSMVDKGYDIQIIIEEINKKLYFLLPSDRFLAAAIMEIDHDYGAMKLWVSGIPSILVCDPKGNLKESFISMHLPLGIVLVNKKDIVPIRFNLEEGDRIYAYTDGLTEVFNIHGDMYGEQRLLESIKINCGLDKRVDAILDDVKEFRNDAETTDDILLLEIACDKSRIKKTVAHKINTYEIKPMNWHVQFKFGLDVICKSTPIPALIQTMVEIQGFGKHREKIFLILSEMYSNAVEHGILSLDSSIKNEENGIVTFYEMRQSKLDELEEANISIEVEHYIEAGKGIISLTMQDDGSGFDYTKLMVELARNTGKSGRGIALLYDLCRKCEYSDGGRKLRVEYEWQLDGVD